MADVLRASSAPGMKTVSIGNPVLVTFPCTTGQYDAASSAFGSEDSCVKKLPAGYWPVAVETGRRPPTTDSAAGVGAPCKNVVLPPSLAAKLPPRASPPGATC